MSATPESCALCGAAVPFSALHVNGSPICKRCLLAGRMRELIAKSEAHHEREA